MSATAPLVEWNVGSDVNTVVVSHGGTRVASGCGDGYVHIWDLRTGELILGPLEGHVDLVESVAWSHDDTRVVSGSEDRSIGIWNARTGNPIGKPLRGHIGSVNSVAFSHDSTHIVSGSADSTIRVWNARTGNLMGNALIGHTGPVYSVSFSPNSSLIVSASLDNTMIIWNAHFGTPVGKPLQGHTSVVWLAAFSPDSTRVVSGSADNTIRIWDARTGAPLGEPLRGHTDWVYSVAFSPNSAHIVSGSADKSIRIWDARTGTPIGEPLRRHIGSVHSVMFSPDSTRVVSGSRDRTICVWEASQSIPSFEMVTSKMSIQEMFECLVRHGCADLTSFTDAGKNTSAVLATGGFGDVRRMVVNGGAVVAVKTLRLHILLKDDDKAVKRAVREVYIWSRLRHTNIQELLGIIVFQGALGMISPWRERGNLQQHIAAHPNVERYPLCIQVASGVSYLHSIGMIHGDLKANNVLVTDDGTLKINDFDYAIVPDSSLRFSATTRLGGGTLRWMAPELLQPEEDENETSEFQAAGKRSERTDIYALAMTMLEIITGAVPYHEYHNDMGIYRAIHNKEPPRRPRELSGLNARSEMMWVLLLECWNHDPTARPDAPTVLELLEFKRPLADKQAETNNAGQGQADIPSPSPSISTSYSTARRAAYIPNIAPTSRFSRLKKIYKNITR